MKSYRSMTAQERADMLRILMQRYEDVKKKGLKLDMSRGKPAPVQLDLSMGLLREDADELVHSRKGTDVRNYGELAGIDEARELFADLMGVRPENVIVGGQSSLNLMYDCIIKAWVFGVYGGTRPWGQQEKVKFLCPVPGYDRHFLVTEHFGIEMINVPMNEDGPDMDMVEEIVSKDETV